MSYHVETTTRFDKEFKKLDKYTQQMIKSWIGKNLQNCENPRAHGKGLTAHKMSQALPQPLVRNRGQVTRLPCSTCFNFNKIKFRIVLVINTKKACFLCYFIQIM